MDVAYQAAKADRKLEELKSQKAIRESERKLLRV
jgi:hypothetical protein